MILPIRNEEQRIKRKRSAVEGWVFCEGGVGFGVWADGTPDELEWAYPRTEKN